MFELLPADSPYGEMPDDFYEDGCEFCGGRVKSTGGKHWYNGSYNCYTMYLICENCGPYEVECV